MTNPGQGAAHLEWASHTRERIVAFRNRSIPLRALLDEQAEAMAWAAFYLEGLQLDRDEVAFGNLAWCATAENRYPLTMLQRCFAKYSQKLLELLQPRVVLLAGSKAGAFAPEVSSMLPATRVVRILHHAHRKGRRAAKLELARVREELERTRGGLLEAG